jgi:hypothetical protein
MYLLVTARKGISSMQLAKEIGITQKSAWFMLDRLREACGGPDLKKLAGIIEIDETYVNGIEANKHKRKKLKAGRGPVGNTPVLGMRERGGRTVAVPIERTDKETVQAKIRQHVETGSTLHTDEAGADVGLAGLFFDHDTVNHSIGEFARNGVTTNGIKRVFAVVKRGMIGVYHHCSPKRFGKYIDEFSFRLNEDNVKDHTLTRLDRFIDSVADKRLTYKALTQ